MKNITITASHLGKIKKTQSIEIKDFTVFIGKNGSGKTWFAKLIYFLTDIKYKNPLVKKHFEKKFKEAFDNKAVLHFTIDEQKRFINDYNQSIKNKYHHFINTKKDLLKNFECSVHVDIQPFDIEFKNVSENFVDYARLMTFEFLDKLFPIIKSHYLPAARANYMITYKYLFESQFNNWRDIMLNKTKTRNISILPEIENNFLQDIYQVDTKSHKIFYSLGSKVEKNILTSGKLSIRNPQSQDLPTYEYKLNDSGTLLDLVATSSAVTELSPLVMYFRHKISEGGNELLIIDEPELSLHPEAQRKLVEILVEAVNSGLKLILVTHSPYILEALNNHLQRAKINNFSLPKEIKNFAALSPEMTAAFLFDDGEIKDILDTQTQLIDDQLLNSFNTINNCYDVMRDIEWDNMHD